MVQIKAEVEGLAQLRAAMGEKSAELEREIHKAVTATGLALRGDIIKRYQRGPASGRVYRKYNPKRTHQASAPGEAPQSDTGRLAAGTSFKELADGVEVVNRIKYAAALEYGSKGKGGRRIEPRPAWRPAADEAQRLLNRLVRDAIAKVVG